MGCFVVIFLFGASKVVRIGAGSDDNNKKMEILEGLVSKGV